MTTMTRRQRGSVTPASPAAVVTSDDNDGRGDSPSSTFSFDGRSFATYQEMVDAKRQRNRDVLASSGLMEAKAAVETAVLAEKGQRRDRGLKRSKAPPAAPLPRRKSSRLSGVAAPGIYIESEKAGRFEVSGAGAAQLGSLAFEEAAPAHYNNRINDGSDLSVAAAAEMAGAKWATAETTAAAERFLGGVLADINDDMPIGSIGGRKGSATPVAAWHERLDKLSLDDEGCTAKVVPERIMSVACHPSPDRIVACAGDKQGHLGIWNVDQYGAGATGGGDPKRGACADGVHLFRPHRGPVSSLAWDPAGTSLISASYDGSVRRFDAATQVFEEVFATYDDSDRYKDKLGHGTDYGYNSWIQSMTLDHRHEGGSCFFLTTSQGNVVHVDTRAQGKITFDVTLSERKINTASLHPNGHTLATAGLSKVVQLWDLRKVDKKATPLAWQHAGRSINSAYFSPSGRRLLTTTQDNHLDLLGDAHLAAGLITKPDTRIRHDNQTGRWLSTLMARWHPASTCGDETFVVGSMKRPRMIEVFDGAGVLLRELSGEGLTAVASRCCFHPNADTPIVVGGSSSGRVTVAR